MSESAPVIGDSDGDRLLGNLVVRGMEEGLHLLARVREAEAKERRLRTELAAAVEEAELARSRYDANKSLTTDMWHTLRDEIVKASNADKP